ncbi:hypothetical protein QLL95_gp0847 [Cotonvirus japonicus]|uniref:Membrane protein n=1 Tax=Cotonvirus japonicus TaxID=2811091 RepID=A0ABM7NT29_9VIRU|nr:hypothetical protein QLL95_gp0847 [Cotonvirus japonicus]BCS83276.1 putative membrane protein [Cotonvirus japonicus]
MSMNNNLQPKLLDPELQKKIAIALKPPQEDYWAPTKSGFQKFYHNFIKPNMFLLIFILIIIILLFYRYRSVKHNRISQDKLNQPHENMYDIHETLNTSINKTDVKLTKQETEDYKKILLYLYDLNKEKLREPPLKNNNFAYPMYPYHKGGSLKPPHNR